MKGTRQIRDKPGADYEGAEIQLRKKEQTRSVNYHDDGEIRQPGTDVSRKKSQAKHRLLLLLTLPAKTTSDSGRFSPFYTLPRKTVWYVLYEISSGKILIASPGIASQAHGLFIDWLHHVVLDTRPYFIGLLGARNTFYRARRGLCQRGHSYVYPRISKNAWIIIFFIFSLKNKNIKLGV